MWLNLFPAFFGPIWQLISYYNPTRSASTNQRQIDITHLSLRKKKAGSLSTKSCIRLYCSNSLISVSRFPKFYLFEMPRYIPFLQIFQDTLQQQDVQRQEDQIIPRGSSNETSKPPKNNKRGHQNAKTRIHHQHLRTGSGTPGTDSLAGPAEHKDGMNPTKDSGTIYPRTCERRSHPVIPEIRNNTSLAYAKTNEEANTSGTMTKKNAPNCD